MEVHFSHSLFNGELPKTVEGLFINKQTLTKYAAFKIFDKFQEKMKRRLEEKCASLGLICYFNNCYFGQIVIYNSFVHFIFYVG